MHGHCTCKHGHGEQLYRALIDHSNSLGYPALPTHVRIWKKLEGKEEEGQEGDWGAGWEEEGAGEAARGWAAEAAARAEVRGRAAMAEGEARVTE